MEYLTKLLVMFLMLIWALSYVVLNFLCAVSSFYEMPLASVEELRSILAPRGRGLASVGRRIIFRRRCFVISCCAR